jgi:shikimate dehydrogenase
VLNRNRGRAERLTSDLGGRCAGGLDQLAGVPCDVLINTTSVGLKSDDSPVPSESIPSHAVVLDAVYDPPRTRFLRDAEAKGARIIGGKWMLVHQAAEQLRIWSGYEPPVDVMADAFEAEGA